MILHCKNMLHFVYPSLLDIVSNLYLLLKIVLWLDAWVTQFVKHQTLDFRSGQDLRALESSHTSGCTLSTKYA